MLHTYELFSLNHKWTLSELYPKTYLDSTSISPLHPTGHPASLQAQDAPIPVFLPIRLQQQMGSTQQKAVSFAMTRTPASLMNASSSDSLSTSHIPHVS